MFQAKETQCHKLIPLALLVRAVEYTNCISAEGSDPPPQECPGYDTKTIC